MGQAKARGTCEVRTKEGIQKRKDAQAARKLSLAAEEAALTPEQRKRRKDAKLLLSTLLAMTTVNFIL
jgi:hypothetical protein